MDSSEGSSSKRNPMGQECDSENSKHSRVTPREQDINDETEHVFTSILYHTNPSVGLQNGPRLRSVNNEPGPSTRLTDGNLESMKNNVNLSKQGISSNDLKETPAGDKSNSSLYENGKESEVQTCQRHKVCMEKAGNVQPSTSSSSKPWDDVENSFKENRKRPSTLKLNRSDLDNDSSSDTENDDYSLGSEDGCIYTYRGGEHLADLPSSFFSLDMGLPLDRHLPLPPNYPVAQPAGHNERNSRASSPDMDFLEMDFDPGPSCEVDTGDESTPDADLDVAGNMPEENEPLMRATPEFFGARFNPQPVPMPSISNAQLFCDVPTTSCVPSSSQNSGEKAKSSQTQSSHVYYGPYITHVNARGEQIVVRRTMSQWAGSHGVAVSLHVSSGDLVSPREILNYDDEQAERPLTHQINQGPAFDSVNLSSSFYHLTMAKKLMGEKTKFDCESGSTPNMAGDAPTARGSVSNTDDLSIGSTNIGPGSTRTGTESIKESTYVGPGTSTEGIASTNEGPASTNEGSASTNEGPGSSNAGCQTSESSPACAMGCVEPPRCMVWSEREACERQVTQIGTSACGATAVVNVFIALGVPVNIDKINSSVGTRQRANNAPLPRYLLSRAVAGCTAADLVAGIQRASDGLVTARFFPTYPERAVSLSHWLADWISLGAVPIVTINLQAGCDGEIPDAWHHQMVFGVSSRGVYLCNPVECVRETALWPRLTSPSVLLVRARDVISRFNANTDLSPLMAVPDRRFHSFNVLGQVVNVIREWRATGWCESGTRTRHVRVPAAYQAGVTVAALTGSEAHRRVMHAAQLPILAPQADP